jgi:putative endonuclease
MTGGNRWLSGAEPNQGGFMKGYMYILRCSDGSYYVGSTKDLVLRIEQHNSGLGANYTKKRLPVELVYFEEFQRIDKAFYREKQIQGWSRKKKEALIKGKFDVLKKLAECKNGSATLTNRAVRLRSPTGRSLSEAEMPPSATLGNRSLSVAEGEQHYSGRSS